MVFVERCFCCSLLITSGFFAAYLLIAYLIALAFELIWIILESSNALPTGAVLLVIEYSAMTLFTSLLLHGLTTKNTFCLIGWMFAVTILTFPEAGLVIYMSVDYWGTEHIYGMTELLCWLIRIIVNIIQIILIHSLHSLWKDDELISNRLREITSESMKGGGGGGGHHLSPLNSQYYQNNGYEHSMNLLNMNTDLKRYGSMPDLWNRPFLHNMHLMPYDVPYGGGCQFATPSEFNARIFVPPPQINREPDKKTQSLLDLRCLDQSNNSLSYAQQWLTETVLRTSGTNLILPPLAEPQQQPRAKSEMNYPINYHHHQHHQIKSSPSPMSRCQSMDALNTSAASSNNKDTSHIIRNRSGFYAQPMESYGVPIYYGPLDGPDFLIYKKQIEKLTSRNSLSNNSADDVQKYRDVVL